MLSSLSIAWEGGGSRGIANGGVYAALENARLLQRVTCTGGASIGALFALFTALRVPAQDVIHRILAINLQDFLGPKRPGKIDASLRYMTQWGVFSADPLFRFVRRLVAEEMARITGRPSDGLETLAQVSALHGCHLLTTVTNVTTQQCVELNDVDHPDVPAYWAVALSMVIPLVFAPVRWHNQYWVDGGIANGLPYDGVQRLSGPQSVILVFAFDVEQEEPQQQDDDAQEDNRALPSSSRSTTPSGTSHPTRNSSNNNNTLHAAPPHLDSIVDYIANLFQTLNKSRGLATFMREFKCHLPNVLLLPTPGVSSLTLFVDPIVKQRLVDASYQRTLSFLARMGLTLLTRG